MLLQWTLLCGLCLQSLSAFSLPEANSGSELTQAGLDGAETAAGGVPKAAQEAAKPRGIQLDGADGTAVESSGSEGASRLDSAPGGNEAQSDAGDGDVILDGDEGANGASDSEGGVKLDGREDDGDDNPLDKDEDQSPEKPDDEEPDESESKPSKSKSKSKSKKNTKCFDAVAGRETPYCRGTCTKDIQTSNMDSAKSVCVCDSRRYGLNCASIPRRGKGGLASEWSEAVEGKVIKPQGPTANPNPVRGVYVVGSENECTELCEGLNSGYDLRRRTPCGAVTTSKRSDGSFLCQIYKVRPVNACKAWLQDGEGSTKWIVSDADQGSRSCSA